LLGIVKVLIIGQGTWLIEGNGGGIGRRHNNNQPAIKKLQLGLELEMIRSHNARQCTQHPFSV